MTLIYYAEKLLPYLKHYNVKNAWQEFCKMPFTQQLVEHAATIVAQWYQPKEEIFYSDIDKKLHNIVQQVLAHLKIKNPRHPIFSVSDEQLAYWRYNNIDDTHWDEEDVTEILDTIFKVFYKLHRSRFIFASALNKCHYFIDYVSCKL